MKSFLVIGECCTDVFVYGEAKRLSPEAPVPVFEPKRVVKNMGMAGNVVNNLDVIIDKFEYEAVLIDWSSEIMDELKKTRYVDEKSNHIFLRVDEGGKVEKMKFTNRRLQDLKADTIIISDYNRGYLQNRDFKTIWAKSKLDSTIILDTKRLLTKEIVRYVDFIKLNQKEYENNLKHLGAKFMNQNKPKFIITLGSQGAKYDGKIYPVKAKETIDVSGAGDTFVAAFAFEFTRTKNIENSIKFSNEMCSIVVGKKGVSTI